MSHPLISRSLDLKRLRDEGYDIEIRAGHLLIRTPYVNSKKEIKIGTLVSEITLAGDTATTPNTHVAYFIGSYPCYVDGSEINQIRNSSGNQTRGQDLEVNHCFSAKPTLGPYKDYYEKMTTYVAILSGPAQSLNPSITARTYPVIEMPDGDSVFRYFDTASSRAGIGAVTGKLGMGKVAILGLGGTGSYILDLVAKTPVGEIHLFDGDGFLNHNAFRAPGAPSIDELRQRPQKVIYFSELYSRMRRNIVAHNFYVDASNVGELKGMNFVFLCLDKAGDKRLIIERLEEWGIAFIDVGMGVELVDESLLGILRVTVSTAQKRSHVRENGRISFSDRGNDNEYARNIQIADLNALNAALAVIKWKKLLGFYRDLESEHYSTYTIDGNLLINEDQA